MVQDKKVKVTYRDNTGTAEIEIVITGKQLQDTVRRRMGSLMPQAQILDMHEVTDNAQQLEINARPKK